jgi:NAD(P)-dependent dehydrogenase (short-subunit alcohol dehydrogenase family)
MTNIKFQPFDLTGKLAVIIGGARDLGYDMAEALAEAGCNLAITSRSMESAEAAAEKLRSGSGVEVMPELLDIRDTRQILDFSEKTRNWKGNVDILVNNAGGNVRLSPGNLFERDPEHIRQLIDINLTGVLLCCQAFGRILADQGWGSIINIASVAGMLGRDRRMYSICRSKGRRNWYDQGSGGIPFPDGCSGELHLAGRI